MLLQNNVFIFKLFEFLILFVSFGYDPKPRTTINREILGLVSGVILCLINSVVLGPVSGVIFTVRLGERLSCNGTF